MQKHQAVGWGLWGALAEAVGVGLCRKRECEGRWAKPTNGQLKGMLGNARGGSEKWEENQKITSCMETKRRTFSGA